jgi:hypothetical protein
MVGDPNLPKFTSNAIIHRANAVFLDPETYSAGSAQLPLAQLTPETIGSQTSNFPSIPTFRFAARRSCGCRIRKLLVLIFSVVALIITKIIALISRPKSVNSAHSGYEV